MSILSVKNLSHAFVERQLYSGGEFELSPGEHMGVVGQNGAGKSTLIQILLGEIVPDSGDIRWQKGLVTGSLSQYAKAEADIAVNDYLKEAFAGYYRLEEEVNRFYEGAEDPAQLKRAADLQETLLAADFYSIDSRIKTVSQGLGINAFGAGKTMGQLSGGQRAKVILARLLLAEPSLLLLDEPTNFLDKEHIAWLTDWLVHFSGAFIVVSHDSAFLSDISTSICDIEFGTIQKYYCGYQKFLQLKTHQREDYVNRYQAQQRQIQRTEEYIRKNKAGVNCKMARGRQKQLDNMEKLEAPSYTRRLNLRFPTPEPTSSRLLTLDRLAVGYSYPLLPPISFVVESGQKLVITGFNGIGKSTLLKTLIGEIPPISGRFRFSDLAKTAYFCQDLFWEDPQQSPLEILSDAYPTMTVKELRSALARHGVTTEHYSRPIGTLSGGEQSKVKLCRMMLRPANFLILDEPNNHLDRETKDSLQKALRDYPGSLLLVSHEEAFYRDLADRIIDISKG